MDKLIKKVSAVCFLIFIVMTSISFAASPADFSFKGLSLGDSVAQMQEKLGEPDFDTEMYHRGVPVIRYTYSADQKIYVSAADKKVVEIFCKSKHYVGPKGVTYGATRAGITDAFGTAEHKQLDGSIYYVFTNPSNKKAKMLLELETEKYYLLSWTYTTLPLDVEEILDIHDDEPVDRKPAPKFNYGGL